MFRKEEKLTLGISCYPKVLGYASKPNTEALQGGESLHSHCAQRVNLLQGLS